MPQDQVHKTPGSSHRAEPASQHLVVVLKGYPRLSETFIAQELLGLERRGFRLALVSLRHPTDKARHPIHGEIKAAVRYLPEYLKDEPGRVLRSWWKARKLPGYAQARGHFWRDLVRDRTVNRIRRFGQACVLAAELPDLAPGRPWLYAHFLHTPGSVTRYAALMSDLPWSFSAHAKDIWTTPEWEKREKLADATWAVTCTRDGWAHLAELAPLPQKVGLVYHGLDLSRFPAFERSYAPRDGGTVERAVHLLSVGRAVPKKGYDDLLAALASLPTTLHWRFTHIGGGSDLAGLKALAESLGIADRIEWLGAQAQERVLQAYREADLFVLASKAAEDGDRDGLPNVLMEAQSQGLACLATSISGIPELINDGETGRMVTPGDADELAGALQQLISDPAHREALARGGQARVRQDFSMVSGLDLLVDRFNQNSEAEPDYRPSTA